MQRTPIVERLDRRLLFAGGNFGDVPGAPADAYEPNDSFDEVASQTAGAANSPNLGRLTSPLTTISHLNTLDDISDNFRFQTSGTGTGDDYVQINYQRGPGIGGNVFLSVYREDSGPGQIVATVGFRFDNSLQKRISLRNQAAGTFGVIVSGLDFSGRLFHLTPVAEHNADYSLSIHATTSGGPDLAASLGTIRIPQTLVPGDRMRLPVKVSNTGVGAALGPVSMRVYASSDTTLDDSDVPLAPEMRPFIALQPGSARWFALPATVPSTLLPGQYHLLVDLQSPTFPDLNVANDAAVSSSSWPVVWGFGTLPGRRGAVLSLNDSNGTPTRFALRGNGTGTVTEGQAGWDVSLSGTDQRSIAAIVSTNNVGVLDNISVDGSLLALVGWHVNVIGEITPTGAIRYRVFRP